MKKVKTIISYKDYEDGLREVNITRTASRIISALITMLTDIQKKSGMSKSMIIGALNAAWAFDEARKKNEAFTDGD